VIWNLDFGEKYRRQTDAARAQMLASECGAAARDFVIVANVGRTGLFPDRALDSQLENLEAHTPRGNSH